MTFLSSLSSIKLFHYHDAVNHSVTISSHFDFLVWLQGDMQHYLPHDIMIAAWGNFTEESTVQHDIISPLAGVRSNSSDPATITPLLLQFFNFWNEFSNKPLTINSGPNGFQLEGTGMKCALRDALQKMRCALVHGINDQRSSHNCIYVLFRSKGFYSEDECAAMTLLQPYMDSALRQVAILPHQAQSRRTTGSLTPTFQTPTHDLSDRETEILYWVTLGKTNPEIGCILSISAFTVKNHIRNIFKKLDVTNRAQAVGKFKAYSSCLVP